MKRVLAMLLACLLSFGMACAEGPDAAVELLPEEDVLLAVEAPQGTVSEPDSIIIEVDPADADPDVEKQVSAADDAGRTGDKASAEADSEVVQQPSEPEEEVEPTVISIKKSKTRKVYLGTEYQFKVPGKKVKSFKSSSKKIATVNSKGLITLKKRGKVKITAKLKSGRKVVLTLKVADPLVPESVAINEGKTASINPGDSFPLSAVVSPGTAPQDVTWKSNRSRVATVDENGIITGMSWGRATITASTENGKKASFTLIVRRPYTPPYMISHAMGGIGGTKYSNSLEAFLENYAEGHRVFEADFEYTSDGKMVLCHDWKRDLFEGHKSGKKPTFERFMKAKIYGEYTPMSIDDLLKLMDAYPDVIIITDSKYTDTATIQKQFKTIVSRARSLGVEDVLDRMMVEFYDEDMFRTVDGIHHFNYYMYMLYKQFKKAPSKSKFKKLALFCQENGVGVIGMPASWWKASYMAIFEPYDINIALYTTNSKKDAKNFLKSGVTALFTDFLPPLED